MANEFLKNKIELPTVGRIVHVYVSEQETAPLAAVVACVPDGGRPLLTHLGVFRADGWPVAMKDVPHKSQAAEHGEVYWDWMPYQKSQAAKTEALQRELDEKAARPLRTFTPDPIAETIDEMKDQHRKDEERQEAAVKRTDEMLADPRNRP